MTTTTHEKPGFLMSLLGYADRGDVIDFDSIYGSYIGQEVFLAMTPDFQEVITSDENPMVTFEKAVDAGHEDAVIMKAPKTRYCNLVL